jgi:hypothetical protein
MGELQEQQLIVNAVNDGYGRAMKYKDQFLAGPADLLIKLADYPAFWLEAKYRTLSPRTASLVWDPGVTPLQRNFLRQWSEVGMRTGVMSLVKDTGGNVSSLKMAIYSFKQMVALEWKVSLTDHRPLGTIRERADNILIQLKEFVE